MCHINLIIKRIVRRFKFVVTKELLYWEYESCRICGHCFKLQWEVEDNKWKEVMNVEDEGGGSLCLDCFCEQANKKNIKLTEDHFKTIEYFNPYNTGWYK